MNDNEPQDYANAPHTIKELRAHRDQDCSALPVRDLLVGILRDIDSGALKLANAVVILGVLDGDDYSLIHCGAGISSGFEGIGMMHWVINEICNAE